MISMFLLIFSYTLLIMIVYILPLSNDKGSAIASCLSFGATLYAAIVAYLILDNWKVQHRSTLTSDYFQKTFNKYVEFKDSLLSIEVLHDAWNEEIIRNHGEIDDFADGGLIQKISKVQISLKSLKNRFNYYSLIFKEPKFKQKIEELERELNALFSPILDEDSDREGQVHNTEHMENAKNLKHKLPNILEKYDDDLVELMSSKILLN